MLKRYEEIQRGAPARHIVLKTIETRPDYAGLSDEELWSLHDRQMEEYRERCASTRNMELERKKLSLLDVKIEIARRILNNCHYCEIRCGANRYKRKGVCGVNATSHISSEFLHYGEEPELVPSHTIFFEGCTFECVYCQNWTISMRATGPPAEPGVICRSIERRHRQGSRNVNFVGGDPTPHLHTILNIVDCTDINIPMVWNSNMYITPESMKLLEGTMDVYLADFRYGNDEHARAYSSARDYWHITTRAFLQAHAQAEVLVRLLVLPGHVECCARPIIEWCAKNLGKDVRFNLMFQYHPDYRAMNFPELGRVLTRMEVRRAMGIAMEAGLTNMV